MTRLQGAEHRKNGKELVECVISVGRDLADSFRHVLRELPGSPQRPKEVADALDINKVLSHRLVSALRKQDPLATAHLIPGPAPLRRVVQAAARKGVPREILSPAETAIGTFDALLRDEFGDRTGLDAIISAHLPSARKPFETLAKQSIYRGMRQIRGVAADVLHYTALLHPGADPRLDDLLRIDGLVGVRRIRPGASFKLGVRIQTPPAGSEHVSLDGLSGDLLERFCSNQPVRLKAHRAGQDVLYSFDWEDRIGLRSARDVVVADLHRGVSRRYHAPGAPPKGAWLADFHVPARMANLDLLLHEDVFPDWEPGMRILHTGLDGGADPNDPTRELDVIDVDETLQHLGRGIDGLRVEEIPNYVEMLRYACDKLGWDPAGFRAYRCRIEYPILGSQVQFVFDRQPEP